jgi:ADP-ribose pyrophosphatase
LDTFYEKTISSKTIYEGRVVHLQVDDVLLPDGKQSKREIVKHPGAVAVIALTADQKLIMVKQFRKPLERSIIEIPAGKLEKGEDPLACAKRELEEETGYTCGEIKHLISFYTSPGFADELIHLYFTNDLKEGMKNPDADEFVELIEVSVDDAKQLIEEKIIYDAKTAYAVQYLQLVGKR